MNASRMSYDYSTKNFHRFASVNGGTPREIYIPRSEMIRPVAEITVTCQVTNSVEVAEKSKPASKATGGNYGGARA